MPTDGAHFPTILHVVFIDDLARHAHASSQRRSFSLFLRATPALIFKNDDDDASKMPARATVGAMHRCFLGADEQAAISVDARRIFT